MNGAIWALIAVDSHGYEFPQAESGKTQNSRDMLVDNILMQELSDGGWDLSSQSADPDITAMAIQALAPYYGTNEDVKKAVDRGIKRLSAIQNNNGSYATYGSETSESCSQVIVALTAMGIDPNTDKRFVKNGRSVLDALLEYANEDGSFRHVLEGEANQIATEQAYYALTAYERFIGGKTRLYDMTDVALQSDKEQAEMVQKMIDAIPEKVKLTDKTQIEAAKAMYDSLSETQKSMVNNYSRLESAEKKLKEIEKNNNAGNGTGTGTGGGNGTGTGTGSGNGIGGGNGNGNGNGNGTGGENGSGTGNGSGTKDNTGKTDKTDTSKNDANKTGGTSAGRTSSAGTAGKTTTDATEKESDKKKKQPRRRRRKRQTKRAVQRLKKKSPVSLPR